MKNPGILKWFGLTILVGVSVSVFSYCVFAKISEHDVFGNWCNENKEFTSILMLRRDFSYKKTDYRSDSILGVIENKWEVTNKNPYDFHIYLIGFLEKQGVSRIEYQSFGTALWKERTGLTFYLKADESSSAFRKCD